MFRFLARTLQRHDSSCADERQTPVKAAAQTDAAADGSSGCGWFDSSWDLRRGLKVIEHMACEPLPAEVPADWLLQGST